MLLPSGWRRRVRSLASIGDEFVLYGTPDANGKSLSAFTLVNKLKDPQKAEAAFSSLETVYNAMSAQRDPNENIQNLKPNPLTLVVSITSATDLKLKLNNHDNPLPEEPCNGVVPDYGSVNDPSHLAQCLHETFAKRFSPPAFKSGYETRTDLPMEMRIEKTVFIKAPTKMKYGDVVKVIDAVKGAGANPVGLQVDDLP